MYGFFNIKKVDDHERILNDSIGTQRLTPVRCTEVTVFVMAEASSLPNPTLTPTIKTHSEEKWALLWRGSTTNFRFSFMSEARLSIMTCKIDFLH